MKEPEINEEEIKIEEIKEEEEKEEESSETHSILTNKEQRQLIIFAKLNRYHSIIFIAPIFCMLNTYFYLKIRNAVRNYYFFNIISEELMHIIAGLFYFLSYFRKSTNVKTNNNNVIKYIYNDSNTISLKKYIVFSIILSFFLFINLPLYFLNPFG